MDLPRVTTQVCFLQHLASVPSPHPQGLTALLDSITSCDSICSLCGPSGVFSTKPFKGLVLWGPHTCLGGGLHAWYLCGLWQVLIISAPSLRLLVSSLQVPQRPPGAVLFAVELPVTGLVSVTERQLLTFIEWWGSKRRGKWEIGETEPCTRLFPL